MTNHKLELAEAESQLRHANDTIDLARTSIRNLEADKCALQDQINDLRTCNNKLVDELHQAQQESNKWKKLFAKEVLGAGNHAESV